MNNQDLEPLAAILAEMRDERIIRIGNTDVTRCLLRNLADRIEAAAERELADAHAVAEDFRVTLTKALDTVCYLQAQLQDKARNRPSDENANDSRERPADSRERPAPLSAPGNAAAMREALERILDIEGYGAPCLEAKCIAQKALEGQQCTPPIAQETTKIEQPGNAAAMREALEFVRDTVLVGWRFPEARERVVAALAAPARNCDRYATVEDAKRAYIAERGHVFIWDGDSSERFERWLFATAAGGAE